MCCLFHRELQAEFGNYFTNAENGDSVLQMSCFGHGWLMLLKAIHFIFKQFDLEFPPSCTSYYGLHTVDCMDNIWQIEKCVLDSEFLPGNLSSAEFDQISSLTLG